MRPAAGQLGEPEKRDHLGQTELWFPACHWSVDFLAKKRVHLYFSILKVPVDVLRFVEQIEHLPDSELKVHLTEVEYPPEILKIVNINGCWRLWKTYGHPCPDKATRH